MASRKPATPRDDFPPHGYLDNPHHSWKLNPSGVLRSRPPLGLGWHVPNYGSYGRNQFEYRAHLHIGLEIDGARLLTPAELEAAGVAVRCDLHTKNRLRYLVSHPAGVRLAATYFLAGEHVLACRMELAPEARRLNAEDAAEEQRAQSDERSAETGPRVRLWLALEIAHNPATSRLWEHGLYAVLPGTSESVSGAGGLVGICPEGDAWVLGASQAGSTLTPAAAEVFQMPWLAHASGTPIASSHEPRDLQTMTLLPAYDLTLPPDGSSATLDAAMARGRSPDQALAHLGPALAGNAASALDRLADEDERFWQGAPQLSGDWPSHWRRGFATDLETLRMVARPSAGVFDGRWDGMQIQAPRVVLAESALDALALAWADPRLARELLLQCFTSAPRPNIPCMREDGSYNMIADDGAICGTGPEWGRPFAVIDALWRRSRDSDWLAALYSRAAAYMRWWLAERTDAEGWLVHTCSWESGQDVSTRFGQQRTGGSDVRHLRPVDLQAASAQACALLADWATALGRPDDEARAWHTEATRLTERTRSLWHDGWFRDFDTHTGRWSEVRDPMQLAPLACALTTDEQTAALRSAFDALPPHAGVYPPLVWPPVAHTALEGALRAGLDERAAELCAEILDRVWRRMDARTLEPDGGLPGVTREYWPEEGMTRESAPSAGIEGYGWGALGVHFLVRYLVGLRESGPDRFRLVPALPAAWHRPGARFVVGPLAYGSGSVTVAYSVPAMADESQPEVVEVQLTLDGLPGAWTVRDEADGRMLASGSAQDGAPLQLAWRGRWLRPIVVAATHPPA